MPRMVFTATDPRLNGGLPTNVSMVVAGGRPTRAQLEAAIVDAARQVAGGSQDYPPFRSAEEATTTAQLANLRLPGGPRGAMASSTFAAGAPTVPNPDTGADASLTAATTAPPGRNLYFGGDPRNPGFLYAEAAPGPNYYRVVNSDAEAVAAIAAGELPVHGHADLPPAAQSTLVDLQYNLPGRIYGRDASGAPIEIGAALAPPPGHAGGAWEVPAERVPQPLFNEEFGRRRPSDVGMSRALQEAIFEQGDMTPDIRRGLEYLQYGRMHSTFNTPQWSPYPDAPPPGGRAAAGGDLPIPSASSDDQSFSSGGSGLVPLHQVMPMLLGQDQ